MKHILFLFCLLSSFELLAQDKIFLKSGDTLSVIISRYDDKSVSYTAYDDPEFTTQSLSADQVTKIQLNNGKIIHLKKSKYPGYYVGVYFGDGIPFGDFAHAEVVDERSGFAEDKPFLSIEGRMRVFRFIGAQADVSVGSFGVNSGPYFDYVNLNDTTSNIVSISGKFSDYKYGTFSIGPDLGFNLGKKFKVFLPVQLSFISISNKGDDEIDYIDNASKITTVYRSSRGVGAGIAIGVKLDYMIGKHIGLGVSAKAQDYSVTMKVQERYVGGTNTDYNWSQNVSFFYAGLNLHYHF